MSDENAMLIANEITRRVGGRVLLDRFSLELEAGEVVALIGANGSGKSTCLKALSMFEPPDQGTLRIGGRAFEFPLRDLRVREAVWPELTVVFQQLFLWPHLTNRENIWLPLRDAGESGAAAAESLVERFGLREFLGRYPNEVSLGQRQRVALVRALALRPKWLLLDEATASLDVAYTSVLLDHLETVRRDGAGVVLVTHLVGFARQIADKVIFLHEGRVMETGTVEILRTPASPELRRFLSLVD